MPLPALFLYNQVLPPKWLNMDVFVLLGIELFSQLHSEVSKTKT